MTKSQIVRAIRRRVEDQAGGGKDWGQGFMLPAWLVALRFSRTQLVAILDNLGGELDEPEEPKVGLLGWLVLAVVVVFAIAAVWVVVEVR